MTFKRPLAMIPGLLIFVLLGAVGNGCHSDKSFDQVRQEVAAEGFALWYPAEARIEPGQIWLYEGALKTKFADRPEGMPVTASEPIHFASLQKPVSVDQTLRPGLGEQLISRAGPFCDELWAGSARHGTIEFTGLDVVGLTGDTVASNAEQCGPGYAKAVDLVRKRSAGIAMVVAVIRAARVEYQLKCEDPYLLKQRLERIRQIVDANVDLKITDSRMARLTLSPKSPDRPLTIGLALARGREVDMPVAELRKTLAADLTKTDKQYYLLIDKSPVILTDDPAPISANESPEVVESVYRRTIARAGNWPRASLAPTTSSTQPALTSATRPTPAVDPTPVPATQPAATPTTQPASPVEPAATEPALKVQPSPAVDPTPVPAIQPAPTPTTQPVPAIEPAPATATEPSRVPQPSPTVGPSPVPVTQPALTSQPVEPAPVPATQPSVPPSSASDPAPSTEPSSFSQPATKPASIGDVNTDSSERPAPTPSPEK